MTDLGAIFSLSQFCQVFNLFFFSFFFVFGAFAAFLFSFIFLLDTVANALNYFEESGDGIGDNLHC